jgi:transcriptional regulator GlxA family with amidase domain
MEPKDPQLKVAILIYPGVELVDMNGPVDVFLHANRSYDRPFDNPRYKVYTVAETTNPLESEGKAVVITPSYALDTCPDPDIIVIPGRIDFTKQANSIPADQPAIDWVAEMARKGKTIMSVCVGLYTLASTGVLNGKKATTHYLSIGYVQQKWPAIDLVTNVRFVQDGQFITTGGITSGIDGALYLVKQLDGPVVAQRVADIMIYNRDAPLPPYTLLPPYPSMLC